MCNSNTTPTREHKFKASDLRRHFGKETMIVRRSGDGLERQKVAQGVKSLHLKYESTICENCNSSVTKESDGAYDQLISYIERNGSDENAISSAFDLPQFQRGSQLYIPLFRYFAKLLGCHLADVGAPIPIHLSRFVAKKNAKNCICLDVRRDIEYQRITSQYGIDDLRYAAHGGLVVITKGPRLLPVRLHTTMTIGRIQFIFVYVFTTFEILEMRLRYPDFVKMCSDQARSESNDPTAQSELERLGLR